MASIPVDLVINYSVDDEFLGGLFVAGLGFLSRLALVCDLIGWAISLVIDDGLRRIGFRFLVIVCLLGSKMFIQVGFLAVLLRSPPTIQVMVVLEWLEEIVDLFLRSRFWGEDYSSAGKPFDRSLVSVDDDGLVVRLRNAEEAIRNRC